ncbi:hypothetical protein CLV52_0048 [Amnibacterium kyonggiense]|uniref:Uncharacterized protein n=2 Tax=Amnibacterium kyonggiense TaxID=595671 RepID=A0A4R7FPL9_9MICO|nr:hypothetical protein CLV52_0048 [Amnibacterium kyonggiense]
MSIELFEFKRLRSRWEAANPTVLPEEGYEPTVNIWIGWTTGLGLARHIESSQTLSRSTT